MWRRLRYASAGWCVRCALLCLPPGPHRDAIALAMDEAITRLIDPTGSAGFTITAHRRAANARR
jgi:hypothetical protein